GAAAVVAEAAAAHPEAGFRYLHHARANKSAALNAALAALAASGPEAASVSDSEAGHLAVFFDDDVRVAPAALEAYAAVAVAHPKAAYFGGPVACDYEHAPPDDLLALFPRSVQGYELRDRGVMADEYLGFNWAAWAGEVGSAGGFDPAYGPGSPTGARGQESDMQRRLRAAGARPVDVPDARVWHYVPRSRSTAAWLRRRRYQEGVSQGLRSPESLPASVGSVLRAGASVVKHSVLGSRRMRHAAVGQLAGALGQMRGRIYVARSPEDRDG
ncbi:MAG: glycosyltransferase, partial [Bacteroidota bacterium]